MGRGIADALLQDVDFTQTAVHVFGQTIGDGVGEVFQGLKEVHPHLMAFAIVAHHAQKHIRSRCVGVHAAVVAHRHFHAALVALVGDVAIGIQGIRCLGAAAAGKQKVAIGVLGVGLAEQLVAQANDFQANGFAVGRADGVVGGLNGQLFDADQHIADVAQRGFLAGQAGLHRGQGFLIAFLACHFGLQARHGGGLVRLVTGLGDLLARGQLLLGFGQAALHIAQLGAGAFKKEAGGNFHGLFLVVSALAK